MLAMRLLEVAAAGERDPARLRSEALSTVVTSARCEKPRCVRLDSGFDVDFVIPGRSRAKSAVADLASKLPISGKPEIG